MIAQKSNWIQLSKRPQRPSVNVKLRALATNRFGRRPKRLQWGSALKNPELQQNIFQDRLNAKHSQLMENYTGLSNSSNEMLQAIRGSQLSHNKSLICRLNGK